MKRIVLCFILVLAISLSVISFTSCDEKKEHTHSYGQWTITQSATCTQTGVRERSCSCGEKQTETIPAAGHNFVDGVCTVCGVKE